MSRFDREGVRHFTARQSVLAVAIVAAILLVLSGGSILSAADEEKPGVEKDLLHAIGKPGSTLADNPLGKASSKLTSKLSPDEKLDPGQSFSAAGPGTVTAGQIPPVTPSYFDPVELDDRAPPRQPLESLLVTGDSLSQPLDAELARRLTPEGIDVTRDAHVGTGISNASLADWGQLSAAQVEEHHPDAVVVFIGANEGYPMPGPDGKDVACCSPEWAAIYANRARQVITNYRQGEKAKVYWLTVPLPRDPARQRIASVVNQAVAVAAQPWRSQVRIIDTDEYFAPDGKYSDSIPVDGEEQIVRESDGIHLNDLGSSLLADHLLDRIDLDFTR